MPNPAGQAPPPIPVRRGPFWLACAAILLTAADTYVVVLALPDIMTGVGLTTAELTRAAPIVSVFLLGYIAMLPMLGRLSDTYGRLPVLLGCVVTFSLGSAVTASAPDLPGVVAGRFLQGLGGGGLVPVTLAMVADVWPTDRRGVPLGAVGAVQELGSVVGPLYGAVLVAVGGWRWIFWANLLLGVMLAAALTLARRRAIPATTGGAAGLASSPSAARRPPAGRDLLGAALAVAAAVAAWLALFPPAVVATDVSLGELVEPLLGAGAVTSPLGLVAIASALGLAVRVWTADRPLVDPRGLPGLLRRVDAVGATLLAAALGLFVLALASPEPETQTLNDGGTSMLAVAAVLMTAFVVRENTTDRPLVPLRALRRPAAWGSLVVSLLVGAALIAALVDIPLFARATAYPDSQLDAALVLLRFLVGLPLGALLGGLALRAVSPRAVTAVGMSLAAVGLWLISGWDAATLGSGFGLHDVALAAAGLGIGLAVAPVNESALAAVADELHGLASSLVVVARSVGMLVGLSGLTAYGLTRFRAAVAELPAPDVLCPDSPLNCPAHQGGLQEALLSQLSAIFLGAAACALLAAVLSVVLLRPGPVGHGDAAGGEASEVPGSRARRDRSDQPMETIMDLDDKLEAKWDQARGRLREAWGALTDDDLDRAEGKRTRLIGILKERTGEATDEIERRVNRLIERL